MKKILFPTDYSKAANNAFTYALHVADKTKSEIITVHVYQKPDVGRAKRSSIMRDIYLNNEMEELEESREDTERLKAIARREKMEHIEMNHIIEEGETLATILEVADREQVDMIIMGSNGQSGVTERIYGSNAAGVVRHAKVFVLTVPEQAIFDGELDSVAIATSFADSEKKAMERFLNLAEQYKLKVSCIHVTDQESEKDRSDLERWKQIYSKRIITFDMIVAEDVIKSLHQYVIDNKVDAIAMLTRKRTLFQKFFSPSLTKKMVYFQKLPVLSLHESAL